jgi:hypothetical protein
MNWASDNPDRNFSADATDGELTDLRELLRTIDVAEYFDDVARMRVGRLISKARSDPANPMW